MDANQKPPSERDWSEQEKEDFFASQDAVTLNFNDLPKQPPIEWSTGAWNGPLIKLDPDDPFGHMQRLFGPAIQITSIVPPEQGWPIAMHCPICKETTIVLSPYGAKPTEDGKEFEGYYKMNDVCGHEDLAPAHNMWMAMDKMKADLLKLGNR